MQTLTKSPPQLLKWVGNKHRMASAIVQHFPSDYNHYFEPFLGSGAVLGTLAPPNAVGSDTLEPLVEIWQMLTSDPESLVAAYDFYRHQIEDSNDKRVVYKQALETFNDSRRTHEFVFLSRACYGGVIRFRKTDGHMSTPVGAHVPISTESFAHRVYAWRERVFGTKFEVLDYAHAFERATTGDLIYCDPPYVDTQKILYGAQEFSFSKLIECIADAKARGVKVALSIDGSKKNGAHKVQLRIPKGIFESQVNIAAGKSMLRRFQLMGQNASGEQVNDKLFLTYT